MRPAAITAYPVRPLSVDLPTGKIFYFSTNCLIDWVSNLHYYSVMSFADSDSLRSTGEIKLQAGMPTEVYLDVSTQTPAAMTDSADQRNDTEGRAADVNFNREGNRSAMKIVM